MRYTPYTESEIQSMHVMEEGTYKFQVLEVMTQDKFGNHMQDKNGNDLARLKLMVWDKESREKNVYTYISGDGAFAYKLRHFAETLGMLPEYEDGTFNIMRTINKHGHAHVIIKKGTMKADGSGEMWPDRNDIKDFVVSVLPLKKEIKVDLNSSELDDDVPF